MAKKKEKTVLGTIITIVVIAAVVWMKYNEVRDGQARDGELRDDQVSVPSPPDPPNPGRPTQPGGDAVDQPQLRPVSLSSSRYQVWKDCTLIDRRGNDGDSFHIQAPHGSEEIRLYYVDAPESAARTYGNGDTNHQRIAEQGADMGGLNQHETTQVGVAAKAFTKKLLKGKKFTVVTRGERVYNSHRKYGFVIVDWNGQQRYLHELLVANGLGRIHTKPMTLPDNTAASRQKQHLRELEKYAQKHHYGAWGVR
ncbi:MAG: thermonuclease family protein [Akkermansiaceae bacterium]|nr:thermonuclease family protein [Akkermansiaceae bacterium]